MDETPQELPATKCMTLGHKTNNIPKKKQNFQISSQAFPTISLTNRGRAIEARLQTAVSVGLVYSIISVHKFEDFMVPRFCWLLFLLQVSWKKPKRNKKTKYYKAMIQKD
jgi:hypothetical protein